MASRSLIALCALTSAWFVAAPAGAHISLNAPKSRYYQANSMQADQNKLKNGPCGATGDSRTSDASLITTYKPGQKVMVTWKETVQHPGHFEISFDTDGQDFPMPGTAPSATSGVTVLAANIADKSSNDYTYEVTLPNVECSKCTLQLVQVMTTKAPPYAASGDLYFNCADIILKGDGSGGSGGAGSAGSAGAGGAAGATPGGTGSASGGSGAGGAPGSAGSSNGGTTAAGASGMGPIGGAAGTAGMTMTGAGGMSNTGFGGVAGSTSSTGGMTSVTSGGALSSGGAPMTSGGTVNTSGGALVTSGGTSVGTSGAGTNPPGDPAEPPGGCTLTLARAPTSASLAWFAAAAALGFAARRRRRPQR